MWSQWEDADARNQALGRGELVLDSERGGDGGARAGSDDGGDGVRGGGRDSGDESEGLSDGDGGGGGPGGGGAGADRDRDRGWADDAGYPSDSDASAFSDEYDDQGRLVAEMAEYRYGHSGGGGGEGTVATPSTIDIATDGDDASDGRVSADPVYVAFVRDSARYIGSRIVGDAVIAVADRVVAAQQRELARGVAATITEMLDIAAHNVAHTVLRAAGVMRVEAHAVCEGIVRDVVVERAWLDIASDQHMVDAHDRADAVWDVLGALLDDAADEVAHVVEAALMSPSASATSLPPFSQLSAAQRHDTRGARDRGDGASDGDNASAADGTARADSDRSNDDDGDSDGDASDAYTEFSYDTRQSPNLDPTRANPGPATADARTSSLRAMRRSQSARNVVPSQSARNITPAGAGTPAGGGDSGTPGLPNATVTPRRPIRHVQSFGGRDMLNAAAEAREREAKAAAADVSSDVSSPNRLATFVRRIFGEGSAMFTMSPRLQSARVLRLWQSGSASSLRSAAMDDAGDGSDRDADSDASGLSSWDEATESPSLLPGATRSRRVIESLALDHGNDASSASPASGAGAEGYAFVGRGRASDRSVGDEFSDTARSASSHRRSDVARYDKLVIDVRAIDHTTLVGLAKGVPDRRLAALARAVDALLGTPRPTWLSASTAMADPKFADNIGNLSYNIVSVVSCAIAVESLQQARLLRRGAVTDDWRCYNGRERRAITALLRWCVAFLRAAKAAASVSAPRLRSAAPAPVEESPRSSQRPRLDSEASAASAASWATGSEAAGGHPSPIVADDTPVSASLLEAREALSHLRKNQFAAIGDELDSNSSETVVMLLSIFKQLLRMEGSLDMVKTLLFSKRWRARKLVPLHPNAIAPGLLLDVAGLVQSHVPASLGVRGSVPLKLPPGSRVPAHVHGISVLVLWLRAVTARDFAPAAAATGFFFDEAPPAAAVAATSADGGAVLDVLQSVDM